MKRSFIQRECYVNCAEHLLNSYNVNIMFEDAPLRWSLDEWRGFFKELRAFGYNTFNVWIPPTLAVPGRRRDAAVKNINSVIACAHEEGIKFLAMLCANTIGGEWFFACPNDPRERAKILEYWRYFAESLTDIDYLAIFPGDPGGCNRNGCTHVTYIELAAEIARMIKDINPSVTVRVGTWGTPFTGWGDDMRASVHFDGSWASLTDPAHHTPEVPCHIWNGTAERASLCAKDLLDRLPLFPEDTVFEINVGFNPDNEIVEGFDGRMLAREVAKTHRISSWDYAASEGELVCYPHFRAPKFKRKRMQDMDGAPYFSALCYTMTPKLSQLMLYTGAQLMIDPDADADALAGDFTEKVFGDRHIGALMEAFEILPAWGYEPRRAFTREELCAMYRELIERLLASRGHVSSLPIFPSVDEYRDALLWHAERFLAMVSGTADREAIQKEYYDTLYEIYKDIPMAADERTVLAARQYAEIGRTLTFSPTVVNPSCPCQGGSGRAE